MGSLLKYEDIISHVVEPLNQILNGEEPNHPLDSAYSRTQVEHSKYNEEMSFVFDDYKNSVVVIFIAIRRITLQCSQRL